MCMSGGVGPVDPPLVDEGACCMGAMADGAEGCTCWRPVYDVRQGPVLIEEFRALADGAEPVTRPRMCGDCAYRPGSPEKLGDPGYRGDANDLEMLAESGTPFWCHDGLRRVVQWIHPSGPVVDAGSGAYDPPIDSRGVPVRADGRPAILCAGWSARRRALEAEAARETVG